tara:strand:- start:1383 stop:1532 length:150 start_codon:yes stop_codon:yes gene_type:complete
MKKAPQDGHETTFIHVPGDHQHLAEPEEYGSKLIAQQPITSERLEDREQ